MNRHCIFPVGTKKVGSTNGFTLVEIAIVLVVVGLLLGGVLGPLSTQVEQSRRTSTMSGIEALEEAIIGFALSAGRVPCPDTDGDGLENPLGGVGGCTNSRGTLPSGTLGVKGVDAWNQSYRYFVSSEFADDIDGTSLGCGAITPGISFELCATGSVTLLDAAGGNAVASDAVVALVSEAKNYGNAASGDETENRDNDTVLVSHGYVSAAGSEFDDIVSWISPNTLRAKMVAAGQLP